jgi:hypothetical protein
MTGTTESYEMIWMGRVNGVRTTVLDKSISFMNGS